MNASEEFLGQRDDDARRASHVAESVLVLVLGHLADEFGAVGAQASDSVVDVFDCKHDAPEAQRVRRCDRRFDLDQFWIAKLRQLKPPVPIWGPHHNDVDLDTFEPVDAVHPRALDRHLAFERHAERGEKSDSGCKVVDDDADVVQSLDRYVPSIAEAMRGGPGRPFSRLSQESVRSTTQRLKPGEQIFGPRFPGRGNNAVRNPDNGAALFRFARTDAALRAIPAEKLFGQFFFAFCALAPTDHRDRIFKANA